MTLAATLKDFGCKPVVLLYSNKKGRFFENAGIRTVALEDFMPSTPVGKDVTIESFLEEGIKYNDVLLPEQQRRPRVGWPGQRARTLNDIYRNYSALDSIIAACKPDQIVVWNGYTGYVANILRLIAHNRRTPSAFLERGLLKNSLFIDRQGVNGASSLNNVMPDFLDSLEITEAEIRQVTELFSLPPLKPAHQTVTSRNVFFPLQVQLDTNIIMYSTYKSMREAFFQIYNELNDKQSQFLIRPHPEELPETSPNIPRYDNVKVSIEESLDHWLNWSDLVVTINSTVGLEALIKGKKVISLGGSIYSSAGLTSSLTQDLGLSDSAIRARLIKYLSYLLRSNLLLSDSKGNQWAVAKQLDLPVANYQASENADTESTLLEEVTIELDFPLNTPLDLTYRKNKVKIDRTWIIGIVKKHVTAKRYSVIPYTNRPTSPAAIKIINESNIATADARFSKTIDIYGNLVR